MEGEAAQMVVQKVDSDKLNYTQLESAVSGLLLDGAHAVVVTGNGLVATFVTEGEEIRALENEVLVVTEEEHD